MTGPLQSVPLTAIHGLWEPIPTQAVPVLSVRMPEPLLGPLSQAQAISAVVLSIGLVQRPQKRGVRKATSTLGVHGKVILSDSKMISSSEETTKSF